MTTHLVLAADIGGTQMRAALVDPDGKIVTRRSARTPAHDDAPAALIELVKAVGSDHDGNHVSAAVVGLPGAVDYDTGKLLWAPNLPERWPDQLSREELTARLGLPVLIANDADLAAVGEAWFGAAAGAPDMGYLTVSTGIGAGIVERGRLLRGVRSLAELGHTVIDWNAWQEGAPSTLEELGSGSGLARMAKKAGLSDLNARGVELAAAEGDRSARDIWRGAIAAGAIAVTNLVMSFYPSTVVIGGGMGRQASYFDAVRILVEERLEHHLDRLAVVPAALGDDAGLLGAAAWQRAIES
jgi:glucokinase